MLNFKDCSVKTKIFAVGVLVPTILFSITFVMYYKQSKQSAIDSYVEKARAICLMAESTRDEMEDKWVKGLFSQEMLRGFADNGETDKLYASIPVVSAWAAAQRRAKEGGYEFRVPKVSPRNPKNEPDELELTALKAMKADDLDEYFVIDESINSVRYFRPVKLTSTCMICHGDPATSMELWGNDKGL
ncbi:MAG: DUF3365 domain-containing protein, partial [Planctomycetes bacterium]|nr:DUF3365 domain-containing protein [Planctomycetota bacterium]